MTTLNAPEQQPAVSADTTASDSGWQLVQKAARSSKQQQTQAAHPFGPHASTTAAGAQHGNSRTGPAPNTGSGSATAASAHWKLMSEAHKSPVDPDTGRIRCRACGRAFAAYTFLAQHLKQRHFGINSEDAKVLEYRQLQQQQQQQGHSSAQGSIQLTAADFPSLSGAPAAAAVAGPLAGSPAPSAAAGGGVSGASASPAASSWSGWGVSKSTAAAGAAAGSPGMTQQDAGSSSTSASALQQQWGGADAFDTMSVASASTYRSLQSQLQQQRPGTVATDMTGFTASTTQGPNTAATGYTAAAAAASSGSRGASKPKPLAAHSLDLGQLIELSSSSKKQQQLRSPQQKQKQRGGKQQDDRKQRLTAEQVKLILAAAAEQGLRVKNGAAELKQKPRGKLSRLKRLIIKERADRQLAAAGHALQQAQAEADTLQQQLAALQQRLEAAQQLQQLLASSSSNGGAGNAAAAGSADGSSSSATADKAGQGAAAAAAAGAVSGSSGGAAVVGTPCCDPQTAVRLSVAALQLAVQRASGALAQAQKAVEKRQSEHSVAQAAWNKAYKVPEAVPEEVPEHQQQQQVAIAAEGVPQQDGTDTVPAAVDGADAGMAASSSGADSAAVPAIPAAAAAPELPSWLGQLGSESDSESDMEESDVGSISSGDSSEEDEESEDSSDGEGKFRLCAQCCTGVLHCCITTGVRIWNSLLPICSGAWKHRSVWASSKDSAEGQRCGTVQART